MAATKSAAKTKTRAKSAGRTASSKRRAAPAKRRASPKATPKAAPKARRPQAFVVSHPHEDDFEGGLRSYAKYRDLGIAAATSGLARAHVIRFVPPFRADVVAIPHYHDVDFQMIYVLKGWLRSDFEGQGTVTMRQGSCWLQPPRLKHAVVDYSDDCEVLEVILPADFDTVELGKPKV